MLDRRELCSKYDLSSVRFVYTGAAPLGKETVDDLLSVYPKWRLGQGYGRAMSTTVFCLSLTGTRYDRDCYRLHTKQRA